MASSKGEVGVKSKSTRAVGPRSSSGPCARKEGAKEDGVGVACRDETIGEGSVRFGRTNQGERKMGRTARIAARQDRRSSRNTGRQRVRVLVTTASVAGAGAVCRELWVCTSEPID